MSNELKTPLTPLHIYVTENGEPGATTTYNELPTTNTITSLVDEKKAKKILDEGSVSVEFQFIVNHLKRKINNIIDLPNLN